MKQQHATMRATMRKPTPAATPMMIRIALAKMGLVRDVEVEVDAEEDLDVEPEVVEVREVREDVGATVISGTPVCVRV
jgi:Fe2+ transport system protein FeoA